MATRRKFIDVEIPLINEIVSVAGPEEKAIGKTIKLDLTRKLRGKSLEITFQIFKDEKLFALPKKMILMKSYIRRMLRKNISYIEDSIKIKCTDIRGTIKPFLITRKRVSRAVRRNLRNTTKEFLIEFTKDKDYLNVCEAIYHGDLQKALLPKLKKIYPLSFCEIRIFETLEISKLKLEKKEVKEDKKPEEEIKEIKKEIKKAETNAEKPKKETEKKEGEKKE